MSQVMLTALIRATVGAVVAAGAAFFATLGAGTTLQQAEIAAGAAFFATLATRGAAEGLYDGLPARQASQLPPPAPPLNAGLGG